MKIYDFTQDNPEGAPFKTLSNAVPYADPSLPAVNLDGTDIEPMEGINPEPLPIAGKIAVPAAPESLDKTKSSTRTTTESAQLTKQPAFDLPALKYMTPEEIKAAVEKDYINPAMALLNSNKPKINQKRQDRLARVAAISAIGDGLRQIFSAASAKKGATITPEENKLIPAMYTQYMNELKDFERRRDQFNNSKLATLMQGLGMTQQLQAQERGAERQDLISMRGENRQDARFDRQMTQQADQFEKGKKSEEDRFNKQLAEGRRAQREGIAAQNKMLDKQIAAGRYKPRTYGGRIKGLDPEQPFTYTNQNGDQVTLSPDQLDLIDFVISKASETDAKWFDDTLKEYNTGDITPDRARQLMTTYADAYMPKTIQLDITPAAKRGKQGGKSKGINYGGRYTPTN